MEIWPDDGLGRNMSRLLTVRILSLEALPAHRLRGKVLQLLLYDGVVMTKYYREGAKAAASGVGAS